MVCRVCGWRNERERERERERGREREREREREMHCFAMSPLMKLC